MKQHAYDRAGQDWREYEPGLCELEHAEFVDHGAPFRLSGIGGQADEAEGCNEDDGTPGIGAGESPRAGHAFGSMCLTIAAESRAPRAWLANQYGSPRMWSNKADTVRA